MGWFVMAVGGTVTCSIRHEIDTIGLRDVGLVARLCRLPVVVAGCPG